jgi:hypothetical protein
MYKNHFRALAAVTLTLGLSAGAFAAPPAQLVALPVQIPDVVSRSTDLGHSDPDRVLHLSVSLPYRDPAGIAAFVDSVSDPASPNYRQFLTPEQVGARFGLDDKQVQSVVDHLKSAGLKINLVGKNRLSILAEGTVAQAESAFNTSIHEFQALNADEPGNTRYFSHTTVPTVPAPIAPYVIDVTGLESFTKPKPLILTPTQTRTLYNLAPMYNSGTQGQNRTVAISNFDGFRLTNVPLYYSHFGLPTPPGGVGSNITVIPISGGAGAGSPDGEGDLDIQMVLGMAPLCNFRIYDGGGSDLIGVLTAEVNDNLSDTISESYGWQLPGSTANAAHGLHVSMSAQGITYMAASGDNGTSLEPFSYPDYEPEVLQVGGTVATVNGSGVRTSEVGWSGSGGGWSTTNVSFNVRPSWQHGTGVPASPNKRLVPDVALHSAGSGGAYQFYYNGGLSNGSVGTSFASPVFAGSLAVCEQAIIAQGGLPPDGAGKRRFGRIQNLIYSQNGSSNIWFDVTSGSNGTLPDGSGTGAAGVGWDYVTGWGAINFFNFVAVIASLDVAPPTPSPMTFAIAPTPASTTSIMMQASLATDASSPPVQYFFDYVSGSGGHDSVWQASQDYTDTGLAPNTFFNYRVKARDSATPAPNETGYSSNVLVGTAIETPTGVSFGTITDTSIVVTADGGPFTGLNFGSSGLFFEMVPAAGPDANVWENTDSTITVTGLTPCTQYTFRVKARNLFANETAITSPFIAATTGCTGCALLGDMNGNMEVEGGDIAGFCHAKLGVPQGGEFPDCADYGTGTLDGDTALFVTDLLGP